jgi:hypothetical protein
MASIVVFCTVDALGRDLVMILMLVAWIMTFASKQKIVSSLLFSISYTLVYCQSFKEGSSTTPHARSVVTADLIENLQWNLHITYKLRNSRLKSKSQEMWAKDITIYWCIYWKKMLVDGGGNQTRDHSLSPTPSPILSPMYLP